MSQHLNDVLAGFRLVVSSPFRSYPHLEVLAIAATLSVIVKEVHGVGCRLVSEDGVFHFADLRDFHVAYLAR